MYLLLCNFIYFCCSTGDRILEYNGTDLREATAEEAAYELAKPAEKVTVLAQYLIDSMYL